MVDHHRSKVPDRSRHSRQSAVIGPREAQGQRHNWSSRLRSEAGEYNGLICGGMANNLHQAFRALQTAFIQLMQNPFYAPSDDPPIVKATLPQSGSGHTVTRKFTDEVKRIGDTWAPGMSTV